MWACRLGDAKTNQGEFATVDGMERYGKESVHTGTSREGGAAGGRQQRNDGDGKLASAASTGAHLGPWAADAGGEPPCGPRLCEELLGERLRLVPDKEGGKRRGRRQDRRGLFQCKLTAALYVLRQFTSAAVGCAAASSGGRLDEPC